MLARTRVVAPLTVTIVAADGRSRSARIEIEAGCVVMQ